MIGRPRSHFRITAKVGQGGMGEVYLAEDTELDNLRDDPRFQDLVERMEAGG